MCALTEFLFRNVADASAAKKLFLHADPFFLYECLNKQATVDDDPTGIRWINNDLIGLK